MGRGPMFMMTGVEDLHLLNVHGEPHAVYLSGVGRYLPLLGRTPSP